MFVKSNIQETRDTKTEETSFHYLFKMGDCTCNIWFVPSFWKKQNFISKFLFLALVAFACIGIMHLAELYREKKENEHSHTVQGGGGGRGGSVTEDSRLTQSTLAI